MRTRLLFPLLTTAACLAAAVPASAATSEAVSENWAGYEATPESSSMDSDFSAVSGSWTQPTVSCTAGTPTYSAYWVGLGGGSEQSDALEQVGTQADCSSSGKASYYAWYELVPKAPVTLKMTINAGDQISARTAVSGSTVTVTLTDTTTGQTVTKTLTMSDPDTTSAEWVAEAPSECQGDAASDCTPLALADFDKVTFTKALATADGHTGSVSDKHWTAQEIALEPESDGFTGPGAGGFGAAGYGASGYGGFGGGTTYGEAASATSSEGAAPSKLSDKGASFTVSYGKSASGATSTGTGTGSTYPSSSTGGGTSTTGTGTTGTGTGSGDGYGGYGYGGYGYGSSGSAGYGGYGYGYGSGSAGGYGYGDLYGYAGDGYADSYGYGDDGYAESYGYGDDGYAESYGYGDSYGVNGYSTVYSEETYDGATGTVYGSGWAF